MNDQDLGTEDGHGHAKFILLMLVKIILEISVVRSVTLIRIQEVIFSF